MSKSRPTIAVVGGGIAGLAAAWELSSGPAKVVLLEGSTRLGGALRSAELNGGAVDVGPDGFLGRRPEALDLCKELNLGDELVPIGASGAAVWSRKRRRPLPAGLNLGIPTRALPVLRSGILGPAGDLRLLLDVVSPRRDRRGPLGDRAVGPLVAHRLGPRVVDRLVDPMLGGIHAGGVYDMSTAASLPLLLAVTSKSTGLMRALRQASPENLDTSPLFWTLRDGMASLPAHLEAALDKRKVEIRREMKVGGLVEEKKGWRLESEHDALRVDGVVFAVPAGVAGALLEPHEANAATLLAGIDYAPVVVVTLEVAPGALDEHLFGTGLLVPRTAAHPGSDDGFLVTACTYLSTKWPNLARPSSVLVRASLGRFGDHRATVLDDETLVARVTEELGVLLGLREEPLAATVTRWPTALPQYRVHHLLRVAGIEAAVSRLRGIGLAGSAYRGIGVPACIESGRAAAAGVLAAVSGRPEAGTSSA